MATVRPVTSTGRIAGPTSDAAIAASAARAEPTGPGPGRSSTSQSTSARTSSPSAARSASRIRTAAAGLDADSAHTRSTGEVTVRRPRIVDCHPSPGSPSRMRRSSRSSCSSLLCSSRSRAYASSRAAQSLGVRRHPVLLAQVRAVGQLEQPVATRRRAARASAGSCASSSRHDSCVPPSLGGRVPSRALSHCGSGTTPVVGCTSSSCSAAKRARSPSISASSSGVGAVSSTSSW
jgi:hypothetical protein